MILLPLPTVAPPVDSFTVEIIKHYADKHDVNEVLALSLAIVESQLLHIRNGKLLVSSKGAVGLLQGMPWVLTNHNLTNIYENADGAMGLVAKLIKRYGGDVWKAMEAYNCGPDGRLGKYKSAAKRFRRKVSVTYVNIKRSGMLWNVYTGRHMRLKAHERAVLGLMALTPTY